MRALLWILGGLAAVVMGLGAMAEPLAPSAMSPAPPSFPLVAGQAHPTPVPVLDANTVPGTPAGWPGLVAPLPRAATLIDVSAPPVRHVPPVTRARAPAMTVPAHLADLGRLRPVSRPLAMVRTPIAVRSGAPLRPEYRLDFTAEARWDDLPRSAGWSRALLTALRRAPHDLSDQVPRDIGTWCPAYATNPTHLREAFWVGVISALARHESTFNPQAVGGGGQWYGLLQIYPPTARHYGCGATTGQALTDPEANLACAARIMSVTVRRDNAVALHDGRWRGIAADWGPMTNRRKREDMIDWVRGQDYCAQSGAVRVAVVPQARPWGDTLAAGPGHHDIRLASISTMSWPASLADPAVLQADE